MAAERDYAQERKTAIKRGETGVGSNSSDAIRHRARRKMEKHLGRKLDPNTTVEHKKKVSDGGGNDLSNLSLKSYKSNSKQGGEMGGKQKNPSKKKKKSEGALHTASK